MTIVGQTGATLNVARNQQAIKLGGSDWDITFKDINLNTDNQVGILDLSQTTGKQKVTFENVKSTGSALYNGGGDTDVYIKGNTSSDVSSTTYTSAEQQGFGSNYYDTTGDIDNNYWRAAANVRAANVIVTEDANLTLTRSVDGDGIVGNDGLVMKNSNDQGIKTDAGHVYVGQGATLNITLKDGNLDGSALKSSERTNVENNNIGIRVNENGTLVTGKDSHVNIKVGHGRIVSFGSPNASNAPGAEGNYVVRGGTWTENHPNISNNVFLGEGSTFNAVGRDGLILGNRGTYLAGKNSKAQINLWGKGAAANVGDFGMVIAGEGSDTKFFADGAKDMGSYDTRFTPFALGEDGKMVVNKDGALTIVITGRGVSSYGDNIQIQSKHYHDPLVWVKDGGTLDLRADSTQMEGEVLSVPLGGGTQGSRTAYFVVDNPKYVNIQRLADVKQAPAYNAGNCNWDKDNGVWGGNLMYMDSTNGNYFQGGGGGVSAFIAQGDYDLYKWTDDHLSNDVQYDSTLTPKVNANNFKSSADQVWNRIKAFYQERRGFSQGDVSVHGDDDSLASKIAQKGGSEFSSLYSGFNPTFSQRLVIMGHNIEPVTPDHPTDYYVKTDVDKHIIREIHYVVDNGTGQADNEMSDISNSAFTTAPTGDQVKQNAQFTGTGYIDITTGDLVQVEMNGDTPVLDKYGHLIAKTDADGKPLQGSIKWAPENGKFNESALPKLKADSGYQFERIDVARPTKNLVDNQGNPVYVQKQQYDTNGNPVFDKDGKPVYMYEQAKDAQGNFMYDNDGNPIYDHNKPLYVQAKDANGQLKWDKDGNPVYEQAKAMEISGASDQTKIPGANINANTLTPEVYYVVYKAKEPDKQTNAKLSFYDDTADHAITHIAVNGKTVEVKDQSVSGNQPNGNTPGDTIDFTNGSTTVDNIIKNGYVIDHLTNADGTNISIGSYKDIHFGNFGDKDKTFTIHFVHGAQLVDPDHPLKTTDPVNKNGIKGLTKDDLQHQVTETINYVQDNADGNQTDIHPAKSQQVTFAGHTYIDKVTGNLISQDDVATVNGDKITNTNRADAAKVAGKVTVENGKVTWEATGKNGKTLPAVDTVTVDGYTYDHATPTNDNTPAKYADAVKKDGKGGKVDAITPIDDLQTINNKSISAIGLTLHYTENTTSLPYKTVIKIDDQLNPGEVILHQKGEDGAQNSKGETVKAAKDEIIYVARQTAKVKYYYQGGDADNNSRPIEIDGNNLEASLTNSPVETNSDGSIKFDENGNTIANTITYPGYEADLNRAKTYVEDKYHIPSKVLEDDWAVAVNGNTNKYLNQGLNEAAIKLAAERAGLGKIATLGAAEGPNYKVIIGCGNWESKNGQLTVRFVDKDTGNEIAAPDTSLSMSLQYITRPNGVSYNGRPQVFKNGDKVELQPGQWNDNNGNFTYGYVDLPDLEKEGYEYVSTDPSSAKKDNTVGGVVGTFKNSYNATITVYYQKVKATYTGTNENKTVTRTINYLDNETKQPIEGVTPVSQQGTLHRTKITDQNGKLVGYGTVSEDGHSYTINNDWTLDKDGWVSVDSPDETAKGYKATPHFEDGKEASTVPAGTVSVTDPQNDVINVYYDHDTTPVKPGDPDDPKKPSYGLTHDDLNKEVTRTINYVNSDGNPVNGSPDGTSTYKQIAHFTRTAIVDKVTHEVIGYDIDGDKTADISEKAGDFAWRTTDSTLSAVKSKEPSEVGYNNVDIPEVQSTTVAYNTKPITVKVTYSKNAQQGAFQIHYIDEDDHDAVLRQGSVSGKIGDAASYDPTATINELTGLGYVQDNDYSKADKYVPQTSITEDNNGKVYVIAFKHGIKDGKTVEVTPTETIHFRYEDGSQAKPDVQGNANGFKFTRTPKVDAVNGHIVDQGTWSQKDYTFNDGQNNVSVIKGYVADKATAGNKTATPTDANVEDTVIYRKISQIIPVDEQGNKIPDTIPVDYTNDPHDPTKVTPDEGSPKVPDGWTISKDKQPDGVTPDPITNTAKVTPTDPTKPTEVVYTKNTDKPVAQDQNATLKIVDQDDNNATLGSYNGAGKDGTAISFNGYGQDTVQGWINKGYEVVGVKSDNNSAKDASLDGTDPNKWNFGKFDDNDDVTQAFTITLKHGTRPVDPDHPVDPQNPVDPEHPDNPTNKKDIPGLTTKDLQKTVTRDFTYNFNDGSSHPEVKEDSQSVTFKGNATIDKVTGQLVTVDKDGNITGVGQVKWDKNSADLANVAAKPVAGYHVVSTSNANADGSVAKLSVNPNSNDVHVVINYAPDTHADETVVGKQVVHYVDGDNNNAKLMDDNTNGTFVFSKDGKTDKWNADSHKFGDATAPVINGYVAEKKTYEGQTATPTDPNKAITIIYHKIAKIIPVGPDGKQIPDVPTPNYTNDPTDPTKVTPDESTPSIPGYHITNNENPGKNPDGTPNNNTVTPNDPTKPTHVTYTKDPEPTKQGSIVVTFHDDTTGNPIPNVGYNSGKEDEGTSFTYDPAKQQKTLEDQGYVYVSTNGTLPTDGKIPAKDVTVTIHMKHGTRPVDPDHPADPKNPVDPTKPNTPTPSDPNLSKKDLQKTVTRDFTYNFTDGSNHPEVKEATQTVTFTGKGTIDLVTGNLVDVDEHGNITSERGQIKWNQTSATLDDVAAKPVAGYHVVSTSNANADGSVDQLSVNPNSNNVHVVINYAPDTHADETVVGTQVVHYVDGDNNNAKLMDDNTNGTFVFTKDGKTDTWNENSHKFGDATAPVINGYVAEKKTYEGQTATPTDPNKAITIIYHKIAKIIPVGPDGKTPIPDVPTPSYKNDPQDPTKVTPDEPVPTIPGMTPSTPSVTPKDPTKDTPVPYTKNPEKAGLTVQYIDQDNNNGVLKSDAVNGNIGDQITYTTSTSIKDFEDKGYVLVNDGFTGKVGTDLTEDNNGKTYKVVFKHGTRPVDPDHPADPNKPVDPTKPDTPKPTDPNLGEKDLKKTITRTIEYQYADGTKAPAPVEQSVNFTGSGTIDLVTGNLVTVDKKGKITSQNGKITWNKDSQDFKAVDGIDHTGYYISGIKQTNSTATVNSKTGAVGTESVTPTSQNSKIVITLTKNPDVPVAAAGSIDYIDDTTGSHIENATFTGSVGQKINYTTAGSIKNWEAKGYDLVSNNFKDGNEVFTDGKNAFEVHLKHATIPVTPDKPGKPGDPVDPKNPDDPHKYPDNYVPQTLDKTITRDVTYVYADGTQADTPVHQEVKYTGNGVLDLVTGGYVTVDKHGNVTGNGQITWTAKDGKDSFDATKSIDTTKYNIVSIKESNTNANVDQTTGVVASQKVTQNDLNSSVVITLANKPVTPTPVGDKGSITVTVHDTTTNKDLPDYGKQSGEQEVGKEFNYDKPGTITDLTNKGYKVINPDVEIPTEVTKGTTNVTIYVEHNIVPVTPDKPGNGLDKNDLTKTVTEKVNYVVDGGEVQAPAAKDASLTFNGTAYYDAVTKKWTDASGKELTDQTKNITWTAQDGHQFGAVVSPKVEGYHVASVSEGYDDGNGNVKAISDINPDSDNVTVTVTYVKDKVVPPVVNTVTGKITYIDDDEQGKVLDTDNFSGKVGDKIDYTTAGEVQDYVNKGYELVSNNFKDGDEIFAKDGNVFEVHFKHGTTTVTPDKPGHPGDPVDPKNPDGPKYPTGTDENAVKRVGTQTVHYEGAGDKTPQDQKQSFDFTRKITFDNVTGKIIDTTPWNVESHTFGKVNTPVVNGYHADKRTAGGTTITPDDLNKTVTVTYAANGHIIPVDPNGKPIPGADQPQFPTDPDDPTKVDTSKIPNVPGWTPENGKPGDPVDPAKNPGDDVKVPYKQPNTPTPKPQPQPQPTSTPTPQPQPQPEPTPEPQPSEPQTVTPHAAETPEEPVDENEPAPAPHANETPKQVPNEEGKTVTPHAVTGGVTITKGGKIINPRGHQIGYVDDNGEVHKTLPQTGDKAELAEAEAILGGIAAGLGLIGLAGTRRRRRGDK